MKSALYITTDDDRAWFNLQGWVEDSTLARECSAAIVARGEVELFVSQQDWEDAEEIESALSDELNDYGVTPHRIDFL